MRYLALGVLTLAASAIGTVFWMINPVTSVFNWLGGHAVRLLGRQPPFDSDYAAWFALSFVWPMLVWPAYAINQRVSGGRVWSFAAVLAVLFFSAGFAIQLWRSSR